MQPRWNCSSEMHALSQGYKLVSREGRLAPEEVKASTHAMRRASDWYPWQLSRSSAMAPVRSRPRDLACRPSEVLLRGGGCSISSSAAVDELVVPM